MTHYINCSSVAFLILNYISLNWPPDSIDETPTQLPLPLRTVLL